MRWSVTNHSANLSVTNRQPCGLHARAHHHLSLIALHCLQRVVTVTSDALVDGQQEEVQPVASLAVELAQHVGQHGGVWAEEERGGERGGGEGWWGVQSNAFHVSMHVGKRAPLSFTSH